MKTIMKGVIFSLLLLFSAGVHAGALSDDQKIMLQDLGNPESFTIMLLQDDDDPKTYHRLETWNYYRLKASFTFYDCELQSSLPLENVKILTLMPTQYIPQMFETEMLFQDVKQQVIKKLPYSQIELPAELVENVELIGLEQLILGFTQQKLIYVETVPLTLENAEGQQ